MTASCFGLGATLSNYVGQIVVEHVGHAASLLGSLIVSIVPIVLWISLMPETLGQRNGDRNGSVEKVPSQKKTNLSQYQTFDV